MDGMSPDARGVLVNIVWVLAILAIAGMWFGNYIFHLNEKEREKTKRAALEADFRQAAIDKKRDAFVTLFGGLKVTDAHLDRYMQGYNFTPEARAFALKILKIAVDEFGITDLDFLNPGDRASRLDSIAVPGYAERYHTRMQEVMQIILREMGK